PTAISPLSLHDALPIFFRRQYITCRLNLNPPCCGAKEPEASARVPGAREGLGCRCLQRGQHGVRQETALEDGRYFCAARAVPGRSEEHTSELQSPYDLV